MLASLPSAVRFHGLFFEICCAAICCAAGCGGTIVDLGDPRPLPYRFGMPRLLSELDTGFANQNPTLTGDLLDLYFSSTRADTGSDVWTAHRASRTDPFDAPTLVAEVNSAMYETSPAIAVDGLAIYVGSDRDGGVGGTDIWSSTRADRSSAWSAPVDMTTLNSADADIPRPPGQHDLVMPLASERGSPGIFETYLSMRTAVDQPFGAPTLVSELTATNTIIVDAFLSDDGLTLLYTWAPGGKKPDIYIASRASTTDRFSLAAPIADINSPDDERDPWLSPDGTTFFFTSDRTGTLQIYEATAMRQMR
jgi:hypothetical protein